VYQIISSTPESLEVKLSAKVDREEYSKILKEIKDKLKQSDSVDLLVDIKELDKMTLGAIWEDLKFDIKNFRVIRKFAIVGGEDSQSLMASISEPFVSEEAKFFNSSEIDKARDWIF